MPRRPADPSPSRARRILRGLFRWSLRALVALLVLGAGASVYGWWAYRTHVLEDPGEHVSREAIAEIIAQESPVLYADGETPVGVFFAQEHRSYVAWEDIPAAWVDAIVAAEDQRYFEHPGVDPKGIARAMWANVQAGSVVAGGSSLTQQTAKNLYYRPDRSLRSKWEELVNALRLEAHYSKEEILEFYANQFHVSANGRGLGIAARYFFDKEPGELSTLECAFIAGMVKAPARYNPFVGSTEARREEARRKARIRTRYVLDRMLATGRLAEAEHARLVEEEIPFKRGSFRYDTNVLVDEVAARLEQAPFPGIFDELGIDNPSTAGIQVVTTVDADLQREATWALWHHLSEVGPLLEGQTLADFREDPDRLGPPDPHRDFPVHDFRLAEVTGVRLEGAGSPSLTLDAGGKGCLVDEQALRRVATILAQADSGSAWTKASGDQVLAVARGLPRGTVVWVSQREPGLCDLELRPELQGAVLVLEQGQIRAMVGGNDNKNFNRALTARRQLGSTWKAVVYALALQHGWAPTDALDNRDNVFYFEGTWYYPRPDHASEPFVSLSWAGTRSENLASIWLLVHLLDRLDTDAYREAAAAVDFVPRSDEDRGAWIVRMRDTYGIIAVDSRMEEVSWTAARQDLLAELDEGSPEHRALLSLSFGRGAAAEAVRVASGSSGSTRARKLRAVQSNYLRYREVAEACRPEAQALLDLAAAGVGARPKESWIPFLGGLTASPPPPVPPVEDFASLRVRRSEARVEVACGRPEGEGWGPVDGVLLEALASGAELELPTLSGVQIERAPLGLLDRLARAHERRRLVLGSVDPYDYEALQYHPDFRALVAMRTMARFAREHGVAEELPPVLSMPLGAVDISLEEAASLYQGLLTGQRWSFPGVVTEASGVPGLRSSTAVAAPEGRTLLIAEIRDRDGNVIYRARPEAEEITDPVAGRLTGDILRNVVRWGTGRRALEAVTLGRSPVPVAGKTGTTNSYRNAAFSGWVPKATADGWSASQGFSLSAYVGYDDNRPMTRGRTRLQGSSGALPVWIGTAQGLADHGFLGAEAPEEAEWEVARGLDRVPVAPGSGLPTTEELAEGRSVLISGERDGDEVEADRRVHVLPPAEGGFLGPVPAPGEVTAEGEDGAVDVEPVENPEEVPEETPDEVLEEAPEEAPPEAPAGEDLAVDEPGPTEAVETGSHEPAPGDEAEAPGEGDSGIVPRIIPR